MATTSEVGNSFRDAVCDLLRTKYPDAQVEQRINGTKVDIVFTRIDDFGTREIVAVECKDYAKPLTKSQITSTIYGQYNVMLENDSVQRVMLVSRKPLGADAAEYMKSWRGATHHTFDQLAESLLGLRSYLEGLASLKPTGDFEYIETRLDGYEGKAIDHIINWIESESGQGLALLGGYGQGKTSFANRLAAHYARSHLENPSSRMPMLLRLGNVVHETQLEGLFGKEFTAVHRALGFQFSTFEHLNRAGRFLLILDGFDEMKHAMTAADFLANFKQFNRLLVGNAKVLLLGRPNALPSDERNLVFRGNKTIGEQQILSAAYAPWLERKLALFSAAESHQLLKTALNRLMNRNSDTRNVGYPDGFLSERLEEVFKEVPEDLLSRPVHLLIVAELASDPSFDLAGFNEFRLYDHFIRTLVERDTSEKRVRSFINQDARLQFQRALAWWAWHRVGAAQGHFFRRDVPSSLLRELPAGNAADEEGKRNEYIVSTLTEEKESGILFFAHRSFQEFLVADYVRLIPTTPATHIEYSTHLTPDVLAFLQQAPSSDFILDWYETSRVSSGPLNASYLDFFAKFPNLIDHIHSLLQTESVAQIDAWTLYILFKASLHDIEGAHTQEELISLLFDAIKVADQDPAATATLAIMNLYSISQNQLMLQQLATALIERCLNQARMQLDGTAILIQTDNMDFAASWLKSVKKVLPTKGKTGDAMLEFKVAALEHACITELRPARATEMPGNPFGDLSETISTATIALRMVPIFRDLPEEIQKEFSQFLSGRQSGFSVIGVSERSNSRSAQKTARGSDRTWTPPPKS